MAMLRRVLDSLFPDLARDLPEAEVLRAVGFGAEGIVGLHVLERLESQLGRSVGIGAFYRRLQDLTNRGLVTWYELPGGPQRGGRNRRFYRLTPTGRGAYSGTLEDAPA